MKTLGKFILVVVVCAVLALLVLRITGLDPKARRPGLWLSGDVVTTPVGDWSFTDKYPTILLQTRTWYGLPHSVTINCVVYNGQLYLHSTFPAGIPFPDGKAWTSAITRDPRVRIKVGNQLYDGVATVVTDPAELAMLNQAAAKKYAAPVPSTATTYYFRLLPAKSESASS